MVAKTLRDAYNILDPRQPVRPDQVEALFVQRPFSPVLDVKTQLEFTNRSLKILFVGHRGSGKSSELAYLSTLLTDEFYTISVPLYNIFKSPSVTHTEVIFAITLRLLKHATDEEVVPRGLVNKVWEDLLEESYHSLRRLFLGETIPTPAQNETSVTIKLQLLAAELETKIGTESYTRGQIREKFEGKISELLRQIQDVAGLFERKIQRKLLLLVEDLDKFDPADTRTLFLDHARTLTEPYPHIIYSFPVAMRYANDFKEISQGFDGDYLLPNISLKHRDGSVNQDGVEAMWQILLRRVEVELFAPGILDKAIELSGGHIKTLIQLCQRSVLITAVAKAKTVQELHLEEAQRKLRDDYIALLKLDQLKLLRQLHNDPDKDLVDTVQAKQELLFNGSLLEYGNSRGPWADVNPIVLELLKRDWN